MRANPFSYMPFHPANLELHPIISLCSTHARAPEEAGDTKNKTPDPCDVT